MDIRLVEEPSEEDVWFVRRNLREYNAQHLETIDHSRYAAFIYSDAGERVGGIVFTEFGRWLEIEFLWIQEAYRGKGIGSRLLRSAMDHGREAGCTRTHTETFSFQALPFYQRFSFSVAYEQKGYPLTSSRYFLVADLDVDGGSN